MPIANCLPTLSWQLCYQTLFLSECKGQADYWLLIQSPSSSKYEHLDWNWPTAISLEFFRYIKNTLGMHRIDWKNYINSGIMWHTSMQFLFHRVLCFDMHQPQRTEMPRKSEYVGSSFLALFLTCQSWRSLAWSCNSPMPAHPDSVGLRCELSGSKYSACCKQLSYKATSTMLDGTKTC